MTTFDRIGRFHLIVLLVGLLHVNDLLRAHLAHLRRRNASPRTIAERRRIILWLDEWFGGRPPLHQLTLDDLHRWSDAQSRRLKANTMHTYTANIRAFTQWAHDTGRLDQNPGRFLELPYVPPTVPRPIPIEHLRTALRVAPTTIRPRLVLGAFLGLRVGEMVAIHGEDVFVDHVGRWLTVHGKGRRERLVPVDDVVWNEIRHVIPARGPAFPGRVGRTITPKTMTQSITAFFRGIGMDYVPHQLRHHAGTRLLQQTGNLRYAQQVLGHADPRTTAGYTDVANAEIAAAMRGLAADLTEHLAPAPVHRLGDRTAEVDHPADREDDAA